MVENNYNNNNITNNLINEQCDGGDCTVNALQIASSELELDTQSLAQKIVAESTLEGVQDLTHLFNVSQVKKQVLRNLTYNQLLDKITSQMEERLDKRADQFSNKDLLDYAKVVSDGIEKAQKQIQSIDTSPTIQITNNTQNNILVSPGEDLDRESRQRVMDAAKAAIQYLMSQGNMVDETIHEFSDQAEEICDEEDLHDTITVDDGVVADDTDAEMSYEEDESFSIYRDSNITQQ